MPNGVIINYKTGRITGAVWLEGYRTTWLIGYTMVWTDISDTYAHRKLTGLSDDDFLVWLT